MSFEGGCLCGSFRYALAAAPRAVADCHCIDCRRSAGAAFVTWGVVERTALHIRSGELRRVRYADRIRGFAACCGTHVIFEDEENSPTLDVSIATLDDPAPFPPDKAIWVEDKLPWVVLDPKVPAYRRRSNGPRA